jgi:hypothetical protein
MPPYTPARRADKRTPLTVRLLCSESGAVKGQAPHTAGFTE